MGRAKIAITIDSSLLREIDELVARSHFPNRSRAIEIAVEAQLERARKGRLAREVANLVIVVERKLSRQQFKREHRE